MDGFERQSDGKAGTSIVSNIPATARVRARSPEQHCGGSQRSRSELLTDDARPLFLTGESLGSGVACLLAAKYWDAIRGLFLITP
jgi:alpha-beta hydrolase superfamily lysophospholipase